MEKGKVCQAPAKLRILYTVSQGIAIILHAHALAAEKWDNFYPEPISSMLVVNIHQNLWKIVDHSSAIYKRNNGGILPNISDEEWKKPIQQMMICGLAVAVFSTFLLMLAATIKKIAQRKCISLMFLVIVLLFTVGSAFLVTYSAVRFKDDHLKILSDHVYNPNNGIPYEEYGVDHGYYVSLATGGLYAVSAAIILADMIKLVVQWAKDNTNDVTPVTIIGNQGTLDI